MSCERSHLRVIVMIATSLLIETTALAQIPFGGGIGALKEQMKERAFVKAATVLLNNDLPIILDATTALPAVDTLPGDGFKPHPLAVSADMLSKPLPPGDYVVNVTAFCTEYSMHRPGRGVAYKLAQLKGHAAQAVSTLLWRGMKAHVPEQRLMSLSWAIQSGLSISEMPATFKADYDRLIPDYESDLSGDFMQELENSYKNASRGTKLPPLDALLGKMGAAGKSVLAAKRQREVLLAQGQSDEVKEQKLFAGQESGVYTPVKAEEGPWTERIPGVAYMRYKIEGGNLASNNVMEIRIAGDGASLISMLGAQQNSNGDITADGLIGYSQGQGAQALIPVLPSAPDIQFQFTKATTPDAQAVVVNYTVTTQLTSPLHFAVYRSPTQDTAPSSNQIAQCDLPSSGGSASCIAGVAGSADSDPLAVGDHAVTFNPQAGLPPNTAFPYVVVVGKSGGQKQVAYFRKFLLGVVAHGFLPEQFSSDAVLGSPSTKAFPLPGWETAMAASLKASDNYDDAIAFDWRDIVGDANPGAAVLAESKLATLVSEWESTKKTHLGDVVDLHFIGHSRGTVIVTQAIGLLAGLDPTRANPPGADAKFGGGYVELTLLDPHPANNCFSASCPDNSTSQPHWASFQQKGGELTSLAKIERRATMSFQKGAVDPPVTIPPGIKKVEVWYQHNSWNCLPMTDASITEYIMNLWGQVDSLSLINHSGLTLVPEDKGRTLNAGKACSTAIGHAEGIQWLNPVL